nr:probable serine incorporator isoform X2 [Ipomoea trifida]
MEGTTSNITSDRYAKIKQGSWFNQFRDGSNPWMARYVYGLMFLGANLLAWAVRDYGTSVTKEMKLDYWKTKLKAICMAAGVKDCNGGEDCLGTEGVLRLFYFVMFLSTAGTSKLSDRREKWHSGWWLAKIAMLLALILLPFLLPVEIISIYGEVAHFGAGVFLLIQLVSIISFITWLNDCCYSEENADKCEPPEEKCIRKAKAATSKGDVLTIISFVVAVLAIVVATFSTGIDSKCFQFWKDDKQGSEGEEEHKHVPYGYGFFHFVFATGAMFTIDVGWTSTWVRIVNEWLAACVYNDMAVSVLGLSMVSLMEAEEYLHIQQ